MEGEIAAFGESHSSTIGGFDFIFEDELSQEQKCPICLLAMRNPVQTICGHRFCESCLLKSFSDHIEPQCPHDRQPIPEGGWFRDVAWERGILSLRVKCGKSGRGCEWTGEIRHYQEHSTVCQYEDVTCNDCYGMVQ
ncbi:TNF receptor-associated factor 6-B-like [Orbicella faveolata]|uniref:TNF receptor-associated factor 6-B-like n=1 Tax=Orbicella faveolata TaxID=48498 RepID=UPI0009E41E1A|nr:TNF receptor-associated factor 6-B-like [Orbicella faveolata]XP_020613480.1 TNF receptor-associated factor 6-B-like [Orbicella faveolata]